MITLKETTERYKLQSGTKKTIQNADQSHGPTGITCKCTVSHRSVSISFDQLKINKITN